MWTVEELAESAQHEATKIDGKWMPARPLSGPFVGRLRDAWDVLRGRADAVKWPGGQ